MGVHEFDQVVGSSVATSRILPRASSTTITDPDVSDDPDSVQVLAELESGATAFVSLGRHYAGGDMATSKSLARATTSWTIPTSRRWRGHATDACAAQAAPSRPAPEVRLRRGDRRRRHCRVGSGDRALPVRRKDGDERLEGTARWHRRLRDDGPLSPYGYLAAPMIRRATYVLNDRDIRDATKPQSPRHRRTVGIDEYVTIGERSSSEATDVIDVARHGHPRGVAIAAAAAGKDRHL